jgi:O-antigen/teichoic acid export membrane protein
MQSNNKLLLKNTTILYVRLIVTSIIGLFTSRFIIRSLGASDFGLYNVVGGVVVMMAFLNTVMVTTTYRYIAFEMGKGNKVGLNKVFNISLTIHLFLALLVIIITETAGVYYVNNYLNVAPGKVTDALFVLRFSAYATVFSILSIPFQGLITAQEDFKAQAIFETIRSLLGLFTAIVIIYYIGNKLKLYALLIAIISIVPSVLFYVYCKRKYNEVVKWNFQFDKSKYKEMIGFSGWVMLGAAASIGQTTGSNLIINSFFGTILNAAFGIAIQVNSIVSMFAGSLGKVAIPQITKSFSAGDNERTFDLTVYVSKYTFFLMMVPSLPILLETKYLLSLWLGNIPPYTVIFCQLLLINALLYSLNSGLPALIQATGKIKYFQIITSFITLICLPLAWLLFKHGYSPPTIIVLYIITVTINLLVSQVLLKKIIDFNFKLFLIKSYFKIMHVTMLVVPLFLIRDIFPAGLLRFIFFSMFAVCWVLVAIYIAGIEKKEKDMLNQIMIKMLKRKNINE